ncbi:hypothetical protein NVP1077O_31 [Vibrio phage 1.077.O._10N.261.45.A10]|nr:hypothetical protein NVP1077O_31 [Vibrio phage 1.077.O._10N.261.45.A10]
MLIYNSFDAAYKAAMTSIHNTSWLPANIRALPASFSSATAMQFVVCCSTGADAAGNVWNSNDYPVAADLLYVDGADEDYFTVTDRVWYSEYKAEGCVSSHAKWWNKFLGRTKPPTSFTPPPTARIGTPKILILGHGRHGKDTVAEILEGMLSFKFVSSSYACLQVIKPVLMAANAQYGYDDWTDEQIYDDRIHHRELWKEAITLVNTPDKAHLTKLVLEQADMYVGMRRNQEFLASKDLFDLVIWVDAFERIPDADPSMDIEYDASYMEHIDNNGGLDALGFQLGILAMKHGWVNDEDI